MGDLNTTTGWNSWYAKRGDDPLNAFLGVHSDGTAKSVTAIFSTRSGKMIEADVANLRSYQTDLCMPYSITRGHAPDYDFKRMPATVRDTFMLLADGVDFIHERQMALNIIASGKWKRKPEWNPLHPSKHEDAHVLAQTAIRKARYAFPG